MMKSAVFVAVGAAVALSEIGAYDVTDDAGLSLLQLSAQFGETRQPGNLCTTGEREGRFCCHKDCGTCGGRGCQHRPGGRSGCCKSQIKKSGKRCRGARMQECLLPRGVPMGMGLGRMGRDLGDVAGEEPEVPPTDISDPQIVEELALCETAFQLATVSHNNLGGAGPDAGDEGMYFPDVAAGVDLKVTATSSYTPNMLNPAGGVLRNGVRNGFGMINLASGSSVDLKFTLIDSTFGASEKVVPSFVVTFFDGDHGMSHESRESFTISGFTNYLVDDESELEVTPVAIDDASLAVGSGVATFTSTLRGTKEDNPTSPSGLSGLQKKRAVTAYFEDKASFTVTLQESGYANPQGRNIFFAGASSMMCASDAKCSSYECPLDWELKQDAEFTICSTKPCTSNDNDKCCFLS